MNFGELYICRLPFTSGAASKTRPALDLFDAGIDGVVCRVTSKAHAGPVEVSLVDWQASGLLKPSVARLDRIVTLEKRLLGTRIGQLSANDE